MKRILVIDDSQFSRMQLRHLLDESRFDVREASNGQQGLDAIHAEKPDCIIVDLLMPGMDGMQLLATLRQQKIAIPCIVVTADIQSTTEQRCRELGAISVLNKPCSQEQLNATLIRIFGD